MGHKVQVHQQEASEINYGAFIQSPQTAVKKKKKESIMKNEMISGIYCCVKKKKKKNAKDTHSLSVSVSLSVTDTHVY